MEALKALLESALGKVNRLDEEAPGLWYCALREPSLRHSTEYYLAELGRDILTAQARTYGTPLKDHPELLLFSIDEVGSGYQIVRYELALYAYLLRPSPDLLAELRAAAVYGAEAHPEYFGEYPAPLDTPRGRTLRSRQFCNGIWLLETDRGERMVAFCYPIWNSDISSEATVYGEQTCQDLAQGIDQVCGYLFFPLERSSIPLYEFLVLHPEYKTSELLNYAALQNVICNRFTDYALWKNKAEEALPPDLGADLKALLDDTLHCVPEAGYEFLKF